MDIQTYLESLPEAILSQLFKSPSSCLAIFRLLTPLAKTIVFTSLFNKVSIQISSFDSLVKPAHRRLQIEALQNLRRLHIVKEKFTSKTIAVNPIFSASLRTALTSGEQNASFGVPIDENNAPVSSAFIHEYAVERWESIQHFMVGNGKRPRDSVLGLLQNSGLMAGNSATSLFITSSGFQFLLQDLHSQVWNLLLHYLNQCTDLDMDPVEVLDFIFMLGSLELGVAYALCDLSETQKRLLDDLTALGLIYHTNAMGPQFYPTHLATMLTAESAERSEASHGFIIIETNYRLYAYTDNPLQISILGLFCHLRSKFPNLVVGRITRESVRNALEKGITAQQIIQYLKTNAHDQMIQGGGELPPTISDQVLLWQLEMDRLRATPGYLYRDFATVKEYNLIVSYARDMGALLWKNDAKRVFFVERGSNAQVLDYVNRMVRAQ